MRKLILLLQAVFLLLACVGCSANNEKHALCCHKDDSYFSEFAVENGKTYIKCVLALENTGKEDVTVKLSAGLPRDVGKLVKEQALDGYILSVDLPTADAEWVGDAVEEEQILNLSPGTHTVEVVFVGTFAGVNQKHDRLLPPKLWYYVQGEDGNWSERMALKPGR